MPLCAVCNKPCRGSCRKCGTRLCTLHKPRSARSKCQMCPTQTRPRKSSYVLPVYKPSIPAKKNPNDFTPEEWMSYCNELIDRVQKKKQRERNYLDRRASRGTHTPTDDAYEQDQILEEELLYLLDHLRNAAIDLQNP